MSVAKKILGKISYVVKILRIKIFAAKAKKLVKKGEIFDKIEAYAFMISKVKNISNKELKEYGEKIFG